MIKLFYLFNMTSMAYMSNMMTSFITLGHPIVLPSLYTCLVYKVKSEVSLIRLSSFSSDQVDIHVG